MRNHFDKISLWNLQTCPTADDKLVRALTWTQLSQTVSLECVYHCMSEFTLELILLTAAQPFASGLLEYTIVLL